MQGVISLLWSQWQNSQTWKKRLFVLVILTGPRTPRFSGADLPRREFLMLGEALPAAWVWESYSICSHKAKLSGARFSWVGVFHLTGWVTCAHLQWFLKNMGKSFKSYQFYFLLTLLEVADLCFCFPIFSLPMCCCRSPLVTEGAYRALL